MAGPPRQRLERALREAGLPAVQVHRETGGYRVGFSGDDHQGFIAAAVVRHNISQGTLAEFARVWAEAAGFLPPTPSVWDAIIAAADELIDEGSRA